MPCCRSFSNQPHVMLTRCCVVGSLGFCSQSLFGWSTGNDINSHYFHDYFSFYFSSISLFLFSPPSTTFLIEGMLETKYLFCESWLECPKTLGWTPFHIWFCKRCGFVLLMKICYHLANSEALPNLFMSSLCSPFSLQSGLWLEQDSKTEKSFEK